MCRFLRTHPRDGRPRRFDRDPVIGEDIAASQVGSRRRDRIVRTLVRSRSSSHLVRRSCRQDLDRLHESAFRWAGWAGAGRYYVRSGTELQRAYVIAANQLDAAPECLAYELTQCEEDAKSWTLRIEWRSTEAHLQSFRKGPHFPSATKWATVRK
jgi:quinol monooxygenase YgiN